MPRVARKKSEASIYHVMSRSISEINLFQCNEDKDYFLSLLKRYTEKFQCKIYAYSLMDNHVHFFIDPQGYDISSFMRCLNTAYVTYYNRRYNRHGHLFQGRFASVIVDNDTYSLTLSAYIHNNAKDLPEYAGHEEAYRYSSYGIYTGFRNNTEGIVDPDFLLDLFSQDRQRAQKKYRDFAESMRDTGILKEIDEAIFRAYTENQYRRERQIILRQANSEELICKISNLLGEKHPVGLRAKYCREMSKFRAFTVYIMRTFCGCTCKTICRYIGNMSVSGIVRLSNEGFKLLQSQTQFRDAFNSLMPAA